MIHSDETWRENVPSDVQRDCDALVAEATAMAKQVKRQTRELTPFALTKPARSDGDLFIAATDEPLEVLREVLQARAESLDSAVVVAEVSLSAAAGIEQAIACYLEHRNGVAFTVLLPYRNRLSILNRVTFDDPITRPNEPPFELPFRIW